MPRRWMRPAILGTMAGMLALVGAVACGDDDDEGEATQTPAAETATPTEATTPGETATPATPGNSAPNEVQVTQDDNGRTVELAVDGRLIVAVPADRDGGYSWSVVEPGPVLLELEGEPRYVPPGSTSPATGAAGTEVFTFEARQAGTADLGLAYARDGGSPEQTFSVIVRIR